MFFYSLTSLLPKCSSDLKYSPCPPVRDLGSRVSGLVFIINHQQNHHHVRFQSLSILLVIHHLSYLSPITFIFYPSHLLTSKSPPISFTTYLFQSPPIPFIIYLIYRPSPSSFIHLIYSPVSHHPYHSPPIFFIHHPSHSSPIFAIARHIHFFSIFFIHHRYHSSPILFIHHPYHSFITHHWNPSTPPS